MLPSFYDVDLFPRFIPGVGFLLVLVLNMLPLAAVDTAVALSFLIKFIGTEFAEVCGFVSRSLRAETIFRDNFIGRRYRPIARF